jgi:hypothetical protein
MKTLTDHREILGDVYKTFLKDYKYLINQHVHYDLRDDFAQHIFVQLLETKPSKIVELYNKNQLRFFIVRLILNQARSNTSSWYYTYIKPDANVGELTPSMINEPDTTELELNTQLECFESYEKIKVHIDCMQWFDKQCAELYLFDGMSMLNISKELNVNESFIYQTLTRVLNSIRRTHLYHSEFFNFEDEYDCIVDQVSKIKSLQKINIHLRQQMMDFYNFIHKLDRNDVHSPTLMQKVFEFYKKN